MKLKDLTEGALKLDPNKWYVWAWDGEVVIYGTYSSESSADAALPKIKADAKKRGVLFNSNQFKIDSGKSLVQRHRASR